jgi:S-formylglutathione hydrolase FrmB
MEALKVKYLDLLLLAGMSFILACLPGCKSETEEPPIEPPPFERHLTNQTYKSTLLDRDMYYEVLLPKKYVNEQDSFPVVYLLHGYGDNETSWYTYGLIEYYADNFGDTNVPAIYVMPRAFNSYYVNKYTGTFPIMDVLVKELVPTIDSVFRTINDADHRAVMGYSMGGYGAIILPAKNPEVFRTGVSLSMSFRTDSQYVAEPQGAWDSQWGAIFGGIGKSGEERLTDYYVANSPFHFFNDPANHYLWDLNFFIDCGDEEETLDVTNNELHEELVSLDYPHVYRMNHGGHSWSYWHHELPEALTFISYAFRQLPYPDTIQNSKR